MTKYKRILIKLSGAAIAGPEGFGLSPEAVNHIADEVLTAVKLGVQVSIVIGGGNIFRGNLATIWGIDRAEADNVGMLGTVINGLILKAALNVRSKREVRVMSAVPMNTVAEPYIRLRAIHHLKKSYIVIFVAGIGQPLVTTDYPAAQRAIETRSEAILVAKNGVEGVYSGDPKKDPSVSLYKTLSYDDCIKKDLRVMDQSAILLARDHRLPIHVFNFDRDGAVEAILRDESLGTYIGPDSTTEVYQEQRA